MRWNVEENEPPLIGTGHIIYLDGVMQHHVTAFDTEEGWVESLCGADAEGPHVDPDNPDQVCTAPRRHGVVELITPRTE